MKDVLKHLTIDLIPRLAIDHNSHAMHISLILIYFHLIEHSCYLRAHYNVVLKSIDVGGQTLSLPVSLFGSGTGGTIVDSGTTLAYLPSTVYQQVLDQVRTDLCFIPKLTVSFVFKFSFVFLLLLTLFFSFR